MTELILQPWPWYVAGPSIALIMFVLLYLDKNLGVSSSYRTLCTMGGAGKRITFFDFKWKDQKWNLMFVAGIGLGGFIASYYLSNGSSMIIAEDTLAVISEYGIAAPSHKLVPPELFSFDSLMTFKGFFAMVIGGFFVGFGARYAGGCTSGHAISGLSNLQLPSLLAVIGFFAGGLAATYLLLPLILK